MSLRLNHKVALVTGAARGIGRAIALRFAAEGCAVAVCDLNREGAEDTAAQCRERGAAVGIPDLRAFATGCDVSQRDDVERAVAEVVAALGVPDVLVNNAAIFFNAPFEQMTDAQWDRMMNINVKSVFMVSQAIIRHWLRVERRGSIINLASISASVAFVNSSAYCTAKAGVASLTRCLALEYGPRGIRANSMAPGIIDTPMLPSAEDAVAWAQGKLPLRRLGQPEDVADVALFLASDDSRYVTGDMIYVDGGWMLE
jgi:3-oxoacyl-[acyl-carrier protein] reductase